MLRVHRAGSRPPVHVESWRLNLERWVELVACGRIDSFKEQEVLADSLTDVFCNLLGYTRPADSPERYTIYREKHVQVDGKFADAVLGEFGQRLFASACRPDVLGNGERDLILGLVGLVVRTGLLAHVRRAQYNTRENERSLQPTAG